MTQRRSSLQVKHQARPARAHPQRKHRRGTAMVVAIIALLLVSAICFSLVRIALAAGQQAERQEWRLQAVSLAESALAQAVSQLRDEPDRSTETWTVDGESVTGQSGRADVSVATDEDDPDRRTITVTADVPDDPTDRVRITRTLTISLPATGSATTD